MDTNSTWWENLMYMIFGYRYNEIKDQIIQEQAIRNEMKDLDDYVNELKKKIYFSS